MKVDHDSEDFPDIENIHFADPLKSKLITHLKNVIILCIYNYCSGARRSTIHHS